MKVTVFYHDIKTSEAVIRFEHKGVTHEDVYTLRKVVPGVELAFDSMGIEFGEEHQLKVIEKLTLNIQSMIDSGDLKNPLTPYHELRR